MPDDSPFAQEQTRADSTKRFSDRVENYIRYRPEYPAAVIPMLASQCGWTPEKVIADIGSGTGISSQLFLKAGNHVFGVEPNSPMREAAEKAFAGQPRFVSIDGTAEQTGLPPQSIDFTVAGQAFHWFDRSACHMEFERIMRSKGWLILMWNQRLQDTSPFLREYEALLASTHSDYQRVNHQQITDDMICDFYAPGKMEVWSTPNVQRFDREGLKGRALSSSYTPGEGIPGHEEFVASLNRLFDQFNEDGQVEFQYSTRVFYGRLGQ